MQTSLFSDSLESMKTIKHTAWKRDDNEGQTKTYVCAIDSMCLHTLPVKDFSLCAAQDADKVFD